MAIEVVMKLIKGINNLGAELLKKIMNSLANPYKSTMVIKNV
ncbi:MAG: hypothetical protein ACP5RS_06835 [Thermoplasmata archaeon]